HDREVQHLLAREVAIQCALSHAARLHDVVHLHLVIVAAGEDEGRGAEDPFPQAGGGRTAPARAQRSWFGARDRHSIYGLVRSGMAGRPRSVKAPVAAAVAHRSEGAGCDARPGRHAAEADHARLHDPANPYVHEIANQDAVTIQQARRGGRHAHDLKVLEAVLRDLPPAAGAPAHGAAGLRWAAAVALVMAGLGLAWVRGGPAEDRSAAARAADMPVLWALSSAVFADSVVESALVPTPPHELDGMAA